MLLFIAVLLLVVWVLSEFLIPAGASWYIRREIRESCPGCGELSVSVSAFPAVRLLFRNYNSLEIRAEGITAEGVRFQTLTLKSGGWPDGTYAAVIPEEEMSRFFSASNSFLEDPVVRLEDGAVAAEGGVDIGFAVIDVSITGTLRAEEGKYVFFEPERIEVAGLNAPGPAVEAVRAIAFEQPVFTVREDLPFTISTISVSDGGLSVSGEVDLQEALEMSR